MAAMRSESQFEAQVAHEFLSRRASMLAEAAAPTVDRAAAVVAPAHPGGDTLNISPEARLAALAAALSSGAADDVIAALRTFGALPPNAPPGEGAGALAQVLARLAPGVALEHTPPEQARALRELVATLLRSPESGSDAAQALTTTGRETLPAALLSLLGVSEAARKPRRKLRRGQLPERGGSWFEGEPPGDGDDAGTTQPERDQHSR